MTWFFASYSNEKTDMLLKYEERRYQNAERANTEMEQNTSGKLLMAGKKQLYFAKNTTIPFCTWNSNLIIHGVYGPVSEEQILRIINELKER